MRAHSRTSPTPPATPNRALEPVDRFGPFDVTAYLTLWLILLYGISANQVLPGLGALGSPAMLVAIPTILIWGAGWLLPGSGLSIRPNPLRAALILYLCYQLLSFGVASARPLTEVEANGSFRAILSALAMAGIALLVADGVPSIARLTALLRRALYAATLFCAFGILQLVAGSPLQAQLPGLVWNAPPMGISARGAFGRAPSTGLHAIEYSVVAGAMLPLAIHFALHGSTRAQKRLATACALIIGLSVPLSSTRSGLLSLVVGLSILFLGWRGRRLVTGLLSAGVAVPLLWATVPGVVGTFIGMFTGTDEDPSIQARLRLIPQVMALIRERPLLGLGIGTWSPEDYFLVDNQVYVTTLEMGMLGMLLTTILLALGVMTAASVRAMPSVDARAGQLSQAIAASTGGFAISLATFDAFHYRILTGTLFLLLGSAGVMWRLHDGSAHLRKRLDQA